MESDAEEEINELDRKEAKEKFDRINTLIVDRIDEQAEIIQKHTQNLYDQIKENQINLMKQAELFETNLKKDVDKMFLSYLEIAEKLNKYIYMLDSVELDEDAVRRIKIKIEKYTKQKEMFKKQFDEFDFNFKFKSNEINNDLLSIGEFVTTQELNDDQEQVTNESSTSSINNTTASTSLSIKNISNSGK